MVDSLTAAKSCISFAWVCIQVTLESTLLDTIPINMNDLKFKQSLIYDYKASIYSKCTTFSHDDCSCPHNPENFIYNRDHIHSIPPRPISKPLVNVVKSVFYLVFNLHTVHVTNPSPSNSSLLTLSSPTINLNQVLVLPHLNVDTSFEDFEVQENPPPPVENLEDPTLTSSSMGVTTRSTVQSPNCGTKVTYYSYSSPKKLKECWSY